MSSSLRLPSLVFYVLASSLLLAPGCGDDTTPPGADASVDGGMGGDGGSLDHGVMVDAGSGDAGDADDGGADAGEMDLGTMPCTTDGQCPTNAFCDTGSGLCVVDVCSPGPTTCDGTDVRQCRANGSGTDVTDTCTGGEQCVVGTGGAACQCVANDHEACDQGDVYAYDSCGVRGVRVQDCTSPQVCTDDGNGALTCALPTVCTQDNECLSTSWCNTSTGMCEPDVCNFSLSMCDGNNLVQCRANGSAIDITATCTGGQQCVPGAGGGALCRCVSGYDLGCYQGDVYYYDSCGVRELRREDCTAPERCIDDPVTGPDCGLPDVCTSSSDCYFDDWCHVESGECRPDVCTSVPAFCSGQQVLICGGGGEAYTPLDTCVNGEQCVVNTGGVGECRCVPNAFLGCYSTEIYNFNSCGQRGTLYQYCTNPQVCQVGADGQPFCAAPINCAADSDCAPGSFCDASLCTPQVCVPQARVCDGDSVLRCNARGSGYDLYDSCTGGEFCDTSGGNAVCSCTQDAYQGCYNGNVANFDSCGHFHNVATSCPLLSPCSDGAAGPACRSRDACDDDGDCDAGEFCELEACVPVVCTPGQAFCSGESIRECNANGSDSTLINDCGAGELCSVVNNAPRCGCVADVAVGCGTDGHVHRFDSCGRAGAIVETCSGGLTCVDTGVGATCSDPSSCGTSCVCANTGTEGCYAGDVYNLTSCNEPASLVEACQGQIECNTIGGPPACRSSVANTSATYYTRSCPLTHQIEHPTALDGDCRCSSNRVPSAGIQECVSAQYLPPATSFGTGPRVRPLAQPHINGGFLDASTREVYVGVDWSSAAHPNSGLVMAIHLDTGNRRIVSGGYDAGGAGFSETGTGPSFHKVIDVRRGADGNLYALSVPSSSVNLEIIRVNPANGQRTLVWRAQDAGFAQCASGDPARMGAQVNDRGFALDSAGNFYLGFSNTSPYGEGVGIVRIAANGMGCSFVTRSGAQSLNAYFGQDVGGGYVFDRGRYQGFEIRNDTLYAVQHAYLTLVEVDLLTGARTRITSASTSSVLGDGPTSTAGLGQRWVLYDAARDLFWTSGTINRRMLIAVDPATGERTEAFCQSVNPDRPWRDLCLGGALIAGYQNEGGMWLDTNGDLILVHENFSLVRANLRDGNSIRFSL
ncbi:MAG: hypothetical protein R3B40_27980 [Polyangiales bacterium]